MLHLIHRVTISIKPRPVKQEQAVSESSPEQDPVPSSIRERNAQEINITNCDVTTWRWMNLVNPVNLDDPVL